MFHRGGSCQVSVAILLNEGMLSSLSRDLRFQNLSNVWLRASGLEVLGFRSQTYVGVCCFRILRFRLLALRWQPVFCFAVGAPGGGQRVSE